MRIEFTPQIENDTMRRCVLFAEKTSTIYGKGTLYLQGKMQINVSES